MARAVEGHTLIHFSWKALTDMVEKWQEEAAGIFQLEEPQNPDQILHIANTMCMTDHSELLVQQDPRELEIDTSGIGIPALTKFKRYATKTSKRVSRWGTVGQFRIIKSS